MKSETRAARNVERMREAGQEEQAEAVERFLTALGAQGLSQKRIDWYSTHLKALAELFGKAFLDPKKEDVERVLSEINERDYSAWTKQNYRVVVKRFYRWLLGDGEDYPPAVRWVKTTMNEKNRLPKILKREEVEALIRAAPAGRMRALFALLADAGLRIGEALSLKVENVIFDKHGARIRVSGKTGTRYVRLMRSLPQLSAWRSEHPTWEDGEWVFPLEDGSGALSYAYARKALKRAVRKAGIKRRVHFHMLRHTEATRLAGKLPQAIMEKRHGWRHGSKMPQVYYDIAEETVDREERRALGLPVEEDEPEPEDCPRCGSPNPPGAPFCWKCRLPVDEAAAVDTETGLEDRLDRLESALKVTLEFIEAEAGPEAAKLLQGPLGKGGKGEG